jgi:hypothetical protein
MTNSPIKILDADEDPGWQKSYNTGLSEATASVPIRAIDGPVAPTPVAISFASTDAQTIIAAPGVGNRIRICSLFFSSAVNVTVALMSGAATKGTVYGQSFSKDWIQPFTISANEAFVMQATTANQIYGQVCYWVESIDNL